MTRLACDGAGLLGAVRAAAANLEAHVEEINELNVYPVPDGDTGSNMMATCRDMLARVPPDESSVEVIADALREGALHGARGNSGVILSQIVMGMAQGFAGKRRFNGLDLAHALTSASRVAYAAVARPVEGTILTVMREAASAAVQAAERDNDIEVVLAATADAAERALARTPSLLPILREHNKVDSGGAGLVRLIEGALAYLRGEPVAAAHRAPAPGPAPVVVPPVEAVHGYETVYLIHPFAGQRLDLDEVRRYLVRSGESVNVAGDTRAAKIHVHNGRPDLVLRHALRLGRIVNATVVDLDHQTDELRQARAAVEDDVVAHAATARARPVVVTAPVAVSGNGRTPHAVATQVAESPARVPLAAVVVAPGDGFADVFRSFAIDDAFHVSIVRGGQGDNPSAGQILDAIREAPADEVVVLPNNPNVKLAALQAGELADRPVRVVATRNAAEGIAALLAVDPAGGASANAAPMEEAGRAIQSFLVTEAIRDATVSGRKVGRGQAMALDPDDGLLAVDDDPGRAVVAALHALAPGFGIVTLWYGDGATLDEAEGVARSIQGEFDALEEVEVRRGGQPHYRYLLSAE